MLPQKTVIRRMCYQCGGERAAAIDAEQRVGRRKRCSAGRQRIGLIQAWKWGAEASRENQSFEMLGSISRDALGGQVQFMVGL
jgi:hypothetical protein